MQKDVSDRRKELSFCRLILNQVILIEWVLKSLRL